MSAWIIQSLLRLRASYYFLPAIMGVSAIVLGLITTVLDLRYQSEIRDMLGWFFASNVPSARSVLTTIAGSMISVAAVTFSLTMVAVTTAAGQYGPRLIGNFMRDRANQITLGMFLSTFLYCIVVLKSVSEQMTIDAQSTVGLSPSLSVLVALILTLISVGVLIFFIHHIPETLNVGNMTASVSSKLIRQIETGRFPETDGLETIDSKALGDPFKPDMTQSIQSQASGYIEAIALKSMLDWAEKTGYRIELLKIPGDFVMSGDRIAQILSDDLEADFDKAAFNEILTPKIWSFIAIGRERTAHQNMLFLADELVEIAARALSPGVNDPFTAVNCIHWYGDVCKTMMNAPAAADCILDSQGTPRIWATAVGFDRLCDTLFAQSRQYVCADENAARMTLETLYDLKEHASDAHVGPIDRQIETLHTAIEESSLGDTQKARLRGGPAYSY